ncbi:hypothetical protein ACE1SV_62040 [Streptomyces sp. E-15]
MTQSWGDPLARVPVVGDGELPGALLPVGETDDVLTGVREHQAVLVVEVRVRPARSKVAPAHYPPSDAIRSLSTRGRLPSGHRRGQGEGQGTAERSRDDGRHRRTARPAGALRTPWTRRPSARP